jgi:hypothetical protein
MKPTRYALCVLVLAATALLGCPDRGPEAEPAIPFFGRNHGVVTRGLDVSGTSVEGEVTLSWQTLLAEDVVILANGEPIDLSGCEPTREGAACHEDGRVTHRPVADTVYTLRATRGEGRCERGDDGRIIDRTQCNELDTPVAVRPPALATLVGPTDPVPAGTDVTFDYEVEHAATWRIGRVLVQDGERILVPCVGESDADAETPCVLPETGGMPATSGSLVLRNVVTGTTLSVTADNGATDGLGRVRDGDVEASVTLEFGPVLSSFEADPDSVEPGGSVDLSWETERAVAVAVIASPEGAVDTAELADCTEVVLTGDVGAGGCTVTVLTGDEDGRVVFTAVALDSDGAESAARTVAVDLQDDPAIDAFAADPAHTVAGGEITLSWETTSVVAVSVSVDPENAVPETDLDGCTGVDGTGAGDCVLTLASDLALDTVVTFALVGQGVSGRLTDAEEAIVTIGEVPEAPTLVADEVSLAALGGQVTLSWTAGAGTTEVVLSAEPAVADWPETIAIDDDLAGTKAADITETTVFTLTARNDFGDVVATATVHVAPSIETLVVTDRYENEVDALGGGNRSVVTGDVTVSWTSTNGTFSQLSHADVPPSGPCNAVEAGDWTPVAVQSEADDSEDWTLHAHRCFRLLVFNDYEPDDGPRPFDVRFFQLRNTPWVDEIQVPATASVKNDDPETILVQMWIDSASTLTVHAQYLDDAWADVGDRLDLVCTQESLTSGTLQNGVEEIDLVTCEHTPAPWVADACDRAGTDCVPDAATRINYVLTVNDDEGPAVVIHSMDLGVVVTPEP